jgi:hypothetical protein
MVNIDLVELEKLATLQCTDDEIAHFFGVTRKTISRKKRLPAFQEAMERGKAKGRISIRRLLYQQAQQGKQGAVAATIFLAKNVLGYRDVAPGGGEGLGRTPSDPQDVMRIIRNLYGLSSGESPDGLDSADASSKNDNPTEPVEQLKTNPAPESLDSPETKGYIQ